MEKLHLTIFINASREKVWDTMLSDATYRDWTSAFNPDSYYEGSWEQGSDIRFVGTNPEKPEDGVSGIASRIVESRKPEFVSIEHLGLIQNGVVDMSPEVVGEWAGTHENYTFTEKDGGTELTLDQDIGSEEKDFMEAAWKKGLARLKELAEQG